MLRKHNYLRSDHDPRRVVTGDPEFEKVEDLVRVRWIGGSEG
jgi:hypothetical protein